MNLAIGVKSSGARKSLDSKMVDVQMAVHRLMLFCVMAALSLSGFGLAMVKGVRSNRILCRSSVGVYSAVVAAILTRGPRKLGIGPSVYCATVWARLGGGPPGRAGEGKNAGLSGSSLSGFFFFRL